MKRKRLTERFPFLLPLRKFQRKIFFVETAKEIYRILGCSGLSRVDMFIDKDERIIFNEINTMPGFTTTSIFPEMLIQSNMTYGEILDKLIEVEIGDCI